MEKILKAKEKPPNPDEIIVFDDIHEPPAGVITLKKASEEGGAAHNRDEFDKRLVLINIEDTATIIYTSGTMGNPKGVMITHKNFVSNVNQAHPIDLDFLSGDPSFGRVSGLRQDED